jgi:hypothetical protein
MTWIFLAVGVVAVLAIAAAFVGSEAFRLGHEIPSAIFDLDEAVDAVGDGLPPDAQARLSYDDVRRLILATLDHLEAKGLSARPGEDVPVLGERDEVVVRDDDALAVVLAAVDAEGLDVSDTDAALVVHGLLAHLGEIGALGPQA